MPKDKPSDPTSVIKMEVGEVIGRYKKRPSLSGALPASVAPFGDIPAWIPSVWRRKKDSDKFELVTAEHPWAILDRSLVLVQKRLRLAGNQAVIAAWINNHKPEPPKLPKGQKRARGEKVPEGCRLCTGTVIYRTVAGNVVGGDEKQGEDVPRMGSDVVAATSRRLDQLSARLWKQSVPQMPVMQARWPIFFRPTGWRLLGNAEQGYSIAFTVDGSTWWHVTLRIPRPKNKRANGQKHKMAYVHGTFSRLVAGEGERGVPSAAARPAADKWIPSTLALVKQDRKWMAILSYRYPERPPYPVQNALVVHCGMRFFAAYQDAESMLRRGRVELIPGGGVLRRKFQFRQQRKRLMRAARKYAKPGRGHKYQNRAYKLNLTEGAFVEDWLHRRVARIIATAKYRKAKIFVGQLANINKRINQSDLPKETKIASHQAPWFKFRTFLEQAAAREGIPIEVYPQRFHSRRCPNPACGEYETTEIDYKRWRQTCTSCGRTQNLEGVAITNAIWDLAKEGKIDLPNREQYQTYFDKMEDELQAREEERKLAREKAHITGVAGERFGGSARRSSKKRKVTRKRGGGNRGRSKAIG